MRTQETIIYRLVLTNPGFGPYLPFSIYGPYKMASWASKPDQKVDPLNNPFGSPVLSKSFFQLF